MGEKQSDGERRALEMIAAEAEQRTGRLDLSGLSLVALPAAIAQLKHISELRCYGEIDEDFYGGKIFDLTPLAGLTQLETLTLERLPVHDLAPLSGLVALRDLSLSYTAIADLKPLASLSRLTEFTCSDCVLIDWDSLPELSSLKELTAAYCSISDVTPLARLSGLVDARLYVNSFRDIRPLATLTQLKALDIDRTETAELRPLLALPQLRYLNCSSVPAKDLQVLTPLWEEGELATLVAHDIYWPGVPAEVLSADPYGDNCLPRLRAHLADLDAGATPQRQTKLMVLGNGRVGKTQLVRRLRHEPFDEAVPSTHGVVVTTTSLPVRTPGQPVDTLHVWDFGGQDLYHGTHSLFMKSGSSAVVAWNPGAESASTHVHQGMRFRNEPLAYWLEFVKGAAGTTAPLLVVQTQCDQASDEVLTPPAPTALLSSFQHKKLLHTSARSGRGFASLAEALQDAVDALLAQQGAVTIGAGRARLMARLAEMRDEDAARPEAERQHRTLTLDHFARLCEEAGGISDPAMALDYLHRCGWVFYRDDMFNQAIVLDQAWALENIYAVFHRSHSFHHIRAMRGRFTLGLLQDTVWRGKGATECQILLDMMRSCEVCFEVRPADPANGIEAEHIAPELLPDLALLVDSLDAERQKIPADATRAELRWQFGFLHSGHLRAALSRVGRCAGEQAWYWREGFLGYEVRHKAWLELGVERSADGHGGSVCFKAVGVHVAELLDEVRTAMPSDWGDPVDFVRGAAGASRRETGPDLVQAGMIGGAASPPGPELAFAPSPRIDARPCVAISYAWGDKTADGRAREAIVDRICHQAQERYSLRLWRDADVMKQGERISRFMRELAAHDRIVIVLSDKYLKSEYCMFELSEIWRRAQQDGDTFLSRVMVWALPDARIHNIRDRLAVAVHWRDSFAELDRIVRQEGPTLLGESDMVKYKQMERYAAEVGNMLTLIADTLLPRNDETDFEPFLQRVLVT